MNYQGLSARLNHHRTKMKKRSYLIEAFPSIFLLGYSIILFIIVLIYYFTDDGDRSLEDLIKRSRRLNLLFNKTKSSKACDWGQPFLEDQESYEHHLKWRRKLVEDRCELCKANSKANQPTLMEDICSFTRNVTPQSFENILVDDKMKVMYCVVPKTACSNWKRALVQYRNGSLAADFNIHKKGEMRRIGFRYLSDYPPELRKAKIETYFKFMFVRNPFDRLLSAYRDKFTRNITWSLYFQRKYGQSIIHMFRPNDTQSWEFGSGVKFEEFIKYIIKVRQKGRKTNAHWTPYAELCQPCHIKYDFIGKFETLEKDSFWLLRQLTQKECPFPFSKRNVNPKLSITNILQYFRTLPGSDLSLLYEIFQTDFDFFGYEIQRVPRTGQIIV